MAIDQNWPKPTIINKKKSNKIVIQINGKIKDLILLQYEANKKQIVDMAIKREKIEKKFTQERNNKGGICSKTKWLIFVIKK